MSKGNLRSILAGFLVLVIFSTYLSGFNQDGEKNPSPQGQSAPQSMKVHENEANSFKPMAMSSKAKSGAEITKKKFPWLIVGGAIVIGAVAAIFLLKKEKKEAAPATTGSILVESTPAGAEIFLDDKSLGKTTNTTLSNIAAGEHVIMLMLLGYYIFEQSVSVKVGQTATVTATLIAAKNVELVRLPGGTFLMGTDKTDTNYFNERPQHQVTLSSFQIGKYEVTQAEWEAAMGSNPSLNKGPNHPVEMVSWDDVQSFVQKLNAATGRSFRLPTEAEWEYACRAGTTEDRYGDSNSIAWYKGNSGNQTHDIAGKAPNSYGLFDMLGNVEEWVQDWYGGYSANPQTNPKGPSSGINNYKVRRGGMYGDEESTLTAFKRWGYETSRRVQFIGFRLAHD